MEFLLAPLIFFGCFGGISILGVLLTIFWIWMLVDCLVYEPNEGNDKIVWAVLIAVLTVLGAILYFLIRRPTRIQQYGR